MKGSGSDALALHLDKEQWGAVDEIARATFRDRRAIVRQAVDAYIELHRWQIAPIEGRLRQARAGEFARDEDVARAFRRKP